MSATVAITTALGACGVLAIALVIILCAVELCKWIVNKL
jgi:hypothetical protein